MHFIGRSAHQEFTAGFSQNNTNTQSRVKYDWYGLEYKHLWNCLDNAFVSWVVNAPRSTSPFCVFLLGCGAHHLDGSYRATAKPGDP